MPLPYTNTTRPYTLTLPHPTPYDYTLRLHTRWCPHALSPKARVHIYMLLPPSTSYRVANMHRMPCLSTSFSAKIPIINGFFAKHDLQLKASYGSPPLCITNHPCTLTLRDHNCPTPYTLTILSHPIPSRVTIPTPIHQYADYQPCTRTCIHLGLRVWNSIL